MEDVSVLIVGGGIGGLAAAVALRRAGVAVRVLERAATLEPLGAGLSLFPNAIHALSRLGVELDRGSMPVGNERSGIWRWDASLLVAQDPQQLRLRYGAPLLAVHRADLQTALLHAAGDDVIVPGAELTRLQQDGDGVTATLADGSEQRAGLLVGADGIDSAVRATVVGDGAPTYSGITAYRGVLEMHRPSRVGEFWGDGGVFGVVPLSAEHVYWFATQRESDPDGPATDLEVAFGDWSSPIPAILERAGEPLRHPLCDRPPDAAWTHGRVTLLGDAAHPMLPFLGQGACQAIEDAEALARAVSDEGPAPAALGVYEAARHKRAAMLVNRSRAAGRAAHLRRGWQRSLRDTALRVTPHAVRQRQLDAVIGTGTP